MASKTRKILLLPGDGIGPEVIAEVRKILEWMNKTRSLDLILLFSIILAKQYGAIKYLSLSTLILISL